MTRESIKSKIAALLAKAEGTDNPHEADTFMAKVNELLERHQMHMHEIRKVMGDQDPMGKIDGETSLYASMTWARDLGGVLAQLYGCKFIYWRRGNTFQYSVIGRDSARITYELMFPFVISQVRMQAKKLVAMGLSKSIAERQIGQALQLRIWLLCEKANETRTELVGKGLIPVSDLDAATAEFFPDLKEGKAKKLSFSQQAEKLAEGISINLQTEKENKKALN